jgi:hypothetical protein
MARGSMECPQTRASGSLMVPERRLTCFPPEPAGLIRWVCFRTRRNARSQRGFGFWKCPHGAQKRAIVEREREFVKRERGILKREREFVERERGILKREREFGERERDILKRERGLGERERGFLKRERGLALSISAQEPRTTPHEPPRTPPQSLQSPIPVREAARRPITRAGLLRTGQTCARPKSRDMA